MLLKTCLSNVVKNKVYSGFQPPYECLFKPVEIVCLKLVLEKTKCLHVTRQQAIAQQSGSDAGMIIP